MNKNFLTDNELEMIFVALAADKKRTIDLAGRMRELGYDATYTSLNECYKKLTEIQNKINQWRVELTYPEVIKK